MSIETKFGSAYVDTNGYLRISSVKEGNHNKLVHRLTFEDFYKTKLPSNIIIHHDDGNRLNNNIWNLIPMTSSEHSLMHHTGVTFSEERCKKISESRKGFRYTEESKQKMREAKLGTSQSKETVIKRSKKLNKTGFFRVYIATNKSCKQGWDYCYNYTENGKRKEIHSVSIIKLKQRVLDKGLDWIVLDEEKAKKTLEGIAEEVANNIINSIQGEQP